MIDLDPMKESLWTWDFFVANEVTLKNMGMCAAWIHEKLEHLLLRDIR